MPPKASRQAPRKRQTPWREPRYMLRVLPDPQLRPPSPVEQATDLSEILEGKEPAKKSKRAREVTDPAPGSSRKKFKKGSAAVLPTPGDPFSYELETFIDWDTNNGNEDDLDWDDLLAELTDRVTKVGKGGRKGSGNKGKSPAKGSPQKPKGDNNAAAGPSRSGGAGGAGASGGAGGPGGNDGDGNGQEGGGRGGPPNPTQSDQGPYEPSSIRRQFRWPRGRENWCYCLGKGWQGSHESWRQTWNDDATGEDNSGRAVIKPGVILRTADFQDQHNQQHPPHGLDGHYVYHNDKFPTPFGYASAKLRMFVVLNVFASSYIGLPIMTYDDRRMEDRNWGANLIGEHVSLRDHRLQYRDPAQHDGRTWPRYMDKQGQREPLVTEYIHSNHLNYIRPTAVVKLSAPITKDYNHPAEYVGYITPMSLQNLYAHFHLLVCRAGGPARSISYNPSNFPHPPDNKDDSTLADPPETVGHLVQTRVQRLDPTETGWIAAPIRPRTRAQVAREQPTLMQGAPQIYPPRPL